MIRRILRVAVPALARGDAERLLRFVGEAESLGGDHPFTGDLLVELGRLVEADSDLLPRARLRTPAAPCSSRSNGQVTTRSSTTSRNCVSSTWRPPSANGAGKETSAPSSSRTSRPEASCTELRFYDVVLRPYGVEHELEVDIPSPPKPLEDVLLRPGRAGVQRARPARPRPSPAPSRPALGGREDAPRAGGSPRRSRPG